MLPGVTVEVASPALIEKVRSTQTDSNGRYQITALSVGTYTVTFTLNGFSTVKQSNVIVSSDFTANVNAKMTVGGINQTVDVKAEAPIVEHHARRRAAGASGRRHRRPADAARHSEPADTSCPGSRPARLRGACNGGVGLFCNPTVPLFNSHTAASDTDGQNQGRIMVDGMSINMGRSGVGINENVGQANGIVLNTAAAQEVSFTLSGSLGESETGGAAINIVPRTGGNRFSGNYSLTYTNTSFFDRNTGTRLTWSPALVSATNPTGTQPKAKNSFIYDYDTTGAFGGPVKKDRMWFYLQARKQDAATVPRRRSGGWLHQPERRAVGRQLRARNRDCNAPRSCEDNGWLSYTNEYKNASVRLTLQATQKNKFNIYWDEQDACTNPCYGMISLINSPESYFTLMSRPNRLMQLSWTNPFTNRLLFDAGISIVPTHQDQTKSREFHNPREIPRVCEGGTTTGRDAVAIKVNTQIPDTNFFGAAGACGVFSRDGLGLAQRRVPRPHAQHAGERRHVSQPRERVLHHRLAQREGRVGRRLLLGEDPQRGQRHPSRTITTGRRRPPGPGTRRPVRATVSLAPSTDLYPCGNMSLYYPEDPNNTLLRPAPIGVDINTGVGNSDERVWFGALYAQDQWTYNRFTINGALRYDHAAEPLRRDLHRTGHLRADRRGAADGAVVLDGAGRCELRRHHAAVGCGVGRVRHRQDVDQVEHGQVSAGRRLRRSVHELQRRPPFHQPDHALLERHQRQSHLRVRHDTNHHARTPVRRVTSAGRCVTAGTTNPSTAFLQFGRPPNQPVSSPTPTPSCGLKNSTDTQKAYCEAAGQDLMQGWGKRRNEWQFGLGIQHEVLPRMSVEVTYNRRKYGNLTDTDTVNQGCDYYQTTGTVALPRVGLHQRLAELHRPDRPT